MEIRVTNLSIDSEGAESVDEVARIRSRIEEYFARSLAMGESRYYLSQLGSQLAGDRTILEALTGKKLVSFVRDELGYEIGEEGVHRNILFAKLGDSGAGPSMPATSIPRYASRFWAAFRVPLDDGEAHRFINLETMAFASERDEVASGPGEVREIDPKFVFQGDGSAAPRVIAECIEQWLAEQQLDPSPFLIHRKNVRREQKSLLDAMIAALSGEQLKRVNLPLDVVKALKDQSN